MSNSPNPSQEYLKNAVLTAPPEQLQLMLYDGAIRFATRGLEALQVRDREECFNALDRAQRIVLELSNGLRPEVNPELAQQMAALYSFIYRRLVDANIHQDPQAIEDALRILRHQRETWVMLLDKLKNERQEQATAAPHQPASRPNSPSASADPRAATQQPHFQGTEVRSSLDAEG